MLHCSFLHKRSLCAKFDSIIYCILVEGVSMDCYHICYIVFVTDIFTSSHLDFLVVLGMPLFFFAFVFYLMPTSLRILHAIPAHFSENAQFCFLLTSLTSFPCVWIFFNDGCHSYAIALRYSYRIFTVSLIFFCFITSELYFIFKCYTLQ